MDRFNYHVNFKCVIMKSDFVMSLNIAVIIKLEPDFSEGNVSYNPDGTLNRAETKNTLGPHSGIAAVAAFFGRLMYEAMVSIVTVVVID